METAEKEPYGCHYCAAQFQDFSTVIYHCIGSHSDERIVIKKLRLCDQSGTLRYVLIAMRMRESDFKVTILSVYQKEYRYYPYLGGIPLKGRACNPSITKD